MISLSRIFRTAITTIAVVFAQGSQAQGIPVYDNLSFINSLQQIIAWGQQYGQMVNQLQQLQQQFQQMQTMTGKLDGARNLGSILNNPSILSMLPAEMQNASQLLSQGQLTANQLQSLQNVLGSYQVRTTLNGNPVTQGQGAADILSRMQQILSSAQARQQQIQQLSFRVDGSFDAKDSMDLANRNIIEGTTATNQLTQTVASIEAARKQDELRNLAEDQNSMDAIIQKIKQRR